ncbi:inositol-3-phosphate synthase [Streptomyces sp. NPDC000134]|uniref:inositol-3-phosphate synthase n=1 Tax=Streptomyces sp. NPDC000134 TaxID=3364536 RepID=UPI0036C873F2
MRTGIWLVGGRGSVAASTVAGAAGIRAGVVAPTGVVSELAAFRDVPLPAFDDLVFGGHDPATVGLVKRVERLAADGVVPHDLPALVRADLEAADAEIRPGLTETGRPAGTADAAVDALAADITDFRHRTGADSVIVVNVASTEPPARPHPAHASWELLAAALHRPDGFGVLPVGSLYACAALRAGCPFVDFTPSTGARLPALDELARLRGLPYAGSDGKTGETLVKSVLAPMFARRALNVRSWSGTNLLGGGDGAALAEPRRAAAKIRSKDRLLREQLGGPVQGGVHIHEVADLGEWKTAWDHITFEGFLGARMTLQFVWQGCDSALAAPLVLDLARFMALAHRADVSGPVPELGFFFKDPVASDEHALDRQFDALVTWARNPSGAGR